MAHRSIPPPEIPDDDLGAPPALRDLLAWGRHRRPRPTMTGLAGAVLLCLVLAVAGWWLLRPAPPPVEASMPRANGAATAGGASPGAANAAGAAAATGVDASGGAGASSTTVAADLVVQAAGAVARPGVYRLPAGSRVDDLVRVAGGLADDADGDRVNLASPVGDGQRVWVPRRGELGAPPVVAGTDGPGAAVGPGSSAGGAPSSSTVPAVVSLSTASADQLDALPGVGPATAAAILAYREAHGPFHSVDDLLDVRGIGEAKLDQLRPLVTP